MQVKTRQSTLARLEAQASRVRQLSMTAMAAAGGGHLGGSFSAADILTALYFEVLRVDPKNPRWPDRDRFVLSKGHASAALCPTLALAGFFPEELLSTFNHLDSPFSMHPDLRKIQGVDMSTGSLGHGLSVGVGMALAGRLQRKDFRVYVLMGDGELGEGSVWEAAMAAAHYRLDRLIGIVDRNKLQMDGPTEQVMNTEPLAEKWRAFGWSVREIDGHDMGQILDALTEAPYVAERPSLIIAHTIKGKGCSLAENRFDWHYHAVDQALKEQVIKELQGAESGRQA